MKFRHYLETIAGIEIYPMLSMLVFLLFFIVLIVYVIRVRKRDIEELENIPLK